MDVTFTKDVDFPPVGPVKAGDKMRPHTDQGENQRRKGLRCGSRRETVLHERERQKQT